MEKLLLYDLSTIFNDANIIDNIHQSIIDLNKNSDIECVSILVNQAFDILNKNILPNLSNELFSLIFTCFSCFPEYLLPAFNSFFSQSKTSYKHIIATLTILSYYLHNHPKLQLPDYFSFVNDAINEIRPQIKNTDNTKISVFTHEIPSQLILDFIIKLLLCTKLTKDLISDFIPYIFKPERITNNSDFVLLIKDINKEGLIPAFPSTILSDFDLLTKLLPESISYFIPHIPDQIFIQFPQIEFLLFKMVYALTPNFIVNFINKCSQNNIKIANLPKYLKFLEPSDFTSQICTYLKRYSFKFSKEEAKKISNIQCIDLLLDFLPTINVLSDEAMIRILLKKTEIENADFSTSEFYIKFYLLFKNERISYNLIKVFCRVFEKFVKEEDSVKILDEIIFSFYPMTENCIYFLVTFFIHIDKRIHDLFYSKEHSNEFIQKIIERKIIPNPLLTQLLDTKTLYEMALNDQKDPLILYLYLFSHIEHFDELIELNEIIIEEEFDNITISSNADLTDENFVKFFNEGSFELIQNVRIENLELISAALIFCIIDEKPVIKGLTKETILPFYAIIAETKFIFDDFDDFDDFESFLSPEMKSLLIEGIKLVSNNTSPIIIFSIDMILQDFMFSNEIKKQILPILHQFLLNDEYFADKALLLSEIIKNKKLFQFDAIQLIEYIFGHISEINLKRISEIFYLDDSESKVVSKLFEKQFEKQSLSIGEMTKSIFLFEHSFSFELDLELKDMTNILRMFDESVNEKNWEDVSLISDLIIDCDLYDELREKFKKNEDKIPLDIKKKILMNFPEEILTEEEIISIIVTSYHPEINDDYIGLLISKMEENEKMNRIGLYLSKFESLTPKLPLTVEDLFGYCQFQYVEDKEAFFESIDQIFILHPTKNVFVINPNYKPLNFSDIEYNERIISMLFDIIKKSPDNYQALFCLKNIALAFPFIFASNPNRVFEVVFPILNDFYLFFESYNDKKEEENRIKKVKASVSALSFLFASLNSTKVADEFVLLYLTKYESFSNSQLFCFNYIVNYLLSVKTIPMCAIFFDHKIFDIFTYMLQRDFKNDLFSLNYYNSVYIFLINFHRSLYRHLSQSEIFIDSFFNIGYNFAYEFSNFITTDFDRAFFAINTKYFILTQQFLSQNNEIKMFIEDIDKDRPFWRFIGQKDSVSQELINEFIDNYKKLGKSFIVDDSSLPPLPEPPTYKMLKYLSKKPKWIFMYIVNKSLFPLLSEHHKYLEETINDLIRINQIGKLTDDDKTKDHQLNDKNAKNYILNNLMFNQNLLNILIEKTKGYGCFPKNAYLNSFSILSANRINLEAILFIISKKIDAISNMNFNASCDVMSTLAKLIMVILSSFLQINNRANLNELNKIMNTFFKTIGYKLIDLVLQPQFRSNVFLLGVFAKLFNTFKVDLPIRVTHIIGFMLTSKNEFCIKNGIQMLYKFKEKQLEHMDIILDVFDDELEKENPNMSILSSFCNYYPSIVEKRRQSINDLMISYLNKYKQILKEEARQLSEGTNYNDSNNNSIDNDSNDNSINETYDDINFNIDLIDVDKIDDDDTEKERLANIIVVLLDFISPKREIGKSFAMSDSIQIAHHKKNPNYLFYPIPQQIYESSPEFWGFFEEFRPLINFIMLKKIKKNKLPDLYQINHLQFDQLKLNIFSSKLVTNYPECFSFEFRSTYFRQKMLMKMDLKNVIKLNIDPNNLLKSSFNQLSKLPLMQWRNLFKIKYNDQEGVDLGGLTRDWFTKLSKELFHPKSSLFECVENKENYIINHSKCSHFSLLLYKFAGMIIARALIQGELLAAHLAKPLLKMILHHEVKFSDLEDADETQFKSLNYYLASDLNSTQNWEVYFVVEDEEHNIIPLIENGQSIRVTNENKKDYVDLMAEYILKKSIIQKVTAFCDGFDALIPHEDIRIFTPNELCLLICGVPKIDVDDLRKNIRYVEPYSEETPVVKMFFNVIKKWDNDNLSKLLFFITGSSRMPSAGFKFFADKNVPITIQPGGDKNRMPAAHTCFNTIDLPEYENEDELNEKLLYAVQNVNSFDFL